MAHGMEHGPMADEEFEARPAFREIIARLSVRQHLHLSFFLSSPSLFWGDSGPGGNASSKIVDGVWCNLPSAVVQS